MDDLRIFKDTDGNDIELDRRRVISVDRIANHPWDEPSDEWRCMVTYRPAVWSVGEGDEPVPIQVDIRVNPAELLVWYPEAIGTLDFSRPTHGETITSGGMDLSKTDPEARRIVDFLADKGLQEGRLPSFKVLVNMILQAQLELNAQKAA